MIKKISFLLITILLNTFCFSQNITDSTQTSKKEKVKKGWNLGALPVIGYDSNLGLLYGVLGNLYDYGDGGRYPKYNHSIYVELSRTTKGGGINAIRYDSDRLIPGTRIFAETSYLTEQALNFYGFNGAEATYNPAYENPNDTGYISKMFYNHDRKMLRLKLDFQGVIIENKLYWFAGTDFYGTRIGTVNIDDLNKGKDVKDTLPHRDLLFDKYVKWGVIPQDQKDGGNTTYLKIGLVYDTRDNEPNPQNGMWEEILLLTAPRFIGNGDYSYIKLAITHRQYFSIIQDQLSFAYRLSYQPKISGTIPFYMLPFIYATDLTRDGLGGAKTVRGILRNRLAGEDMAFGNFEFRWKFYKKLLFNQNFYFALNPFFDMGIVTKPYSFNTSGIPSNVKIKQDKEKLHMGYGMGLHIAMNQNFILAIDYGLAADKNDGTSGLYIGLNFLF